MHSSRMRTVRCSSHPGGGVCTGGVYPGAVSARGRGVFLPCGVYTSPRGQTDTCENITFPQLLLRTVKMQKKENIFRTNDFFSHTYCISIDSCYDRSSCFGKFSPVTQEVVFVNARKSHGLHLLDVCPSYK